MSPWGDARGSLANFLAGCFLRPAAELTDHLGNILGPVLCDYGQACDQDYGYEYDPDYEYDSDCDYEND